MPQRTPGDNSSGLQAEQLVQLCRLLPLSAASSVLLGLIVFVVVWRATSHVSVIIWFALLGGCNAWRVVYWFKHGRTQTSGAGANQMDLAARARRDLRLSWLISGLIWGSSTVLFFPAAANVELQLFLVFVLAGVTAGSAISLADDRLSALMFQAPALSPLAARLLLSHDAIHVSMGLMVIIYAGFIIASAHWVGKYITENLILRQQALEREKALHEGESRYRELALHDALTGLPNRHALQSALSQRLTQARDTACGLILIYLDIDNFKDINDSRGHGCGDALLVEVARRLRSHTNPEDLLVRVGGDEFIIVRMAVSSRPAAKSFASQLNLVVTRPWLFEGEPINIYVSSGISLYPEDGIDADMLIKHADMALYEAKEQGRNNCRVFSAEMRQNLQERTWLERALGEAVRNRQLFVEYQPVVELLSRRIIGLEALARWHHPERGLISPATFIPIAEQYGLIDALGEHVLHLICRQLRTWTNDGVPLVPVSINVSPGQFDRGRIADLIGTVAGGFELDPKLLQIEITEAALIRRATHHRTTLEAIRSMGTKVHFGTGYSSFSYLKHMPIDGLKIDRSFVRDMGTDARDAAVIAAIIAIGRGLGIRVIAEGVESEEQARQLAGMDCSAAQGFYFYRPMAAAECCDLLRQFGQHYRWTETLRKRILQRARA